MRVYVKIGDLATCPVLLADGEPPIIFDLQEAIKLQRPTKFHATDPDEIIVRPPTSTGVAERIDPTGPLNFGTNRGSPEHPFVVDAPTAAAPGAAAMAARDSPRDTVESVFAVFDTVDKVLVPVGTCFAVSDRHLISCRHFMRGKTLHYKITPIAEKIGGNVTFPKGSMDVKVIKKGKSVTKGEDFDYSVMMLVKEPYNLKALRISLDDIAFDTDLKVFHFPAMDFNSRVSGQISPYATWLKSSTPGSLTIGCSGAGLSKGASGGPYVLRSGEVVGIHVEAVSDSEGVSFGKGFNDEEKLEALSTSINSNRDAQGSIATALLISKCPELVDFLREIECKLK